MEPRIAASMTGLTMRLRRAHAADLPLLAHWNAQPHVIAATGDDGAVDWSTELLRNPPWREFLIGEVDGRSFGFVQIIDPAEEETHYWGKVEANLRAIDIWIGEESDTGKGYGTRMMRLALQRCFVDPTVKAVLIDPLVSNTRAHRFYERLGFLPVERRMFGNDDCLVYRLERQAWTELTLLKWPTRP
jgi:aminoglycoside 6'-N-acetyltransferase